MVLFSRAILIFLVVTLELHEHVKFEGLMLDKSQIRQKVEPLTGKKT